MQHAAVLPLVKSRKALILQQNLEFTSSRQNPPFFFIISAPFSIIYPVFCIFSSHFHTPLLFTPYNNTKTRTDRHITYYSLICPWVSSIDSYNSSWARRANFPPNATYLRTPPPPLKKIRKRRVPWRVAHTSTTSINNYRCSVHYSIK